MSVTSVPSRSFPQAHRRRLAILLVVSLALARSDAFSQLATLRDVMTFKAWRDARSRRVAESKRRDLETPL
jgi:hypothetical protein